MGAFGTAVLVLIAIAYASAEEKAPSAPRDILIFGGNGFMGASMVEAFLTRGDKVTIVNRKNWYWDSKTRIAPRVNLLYCDRKAEIKTCTELTEFLSKNEKLDVVVDFSTYGSHEIKEASKILKDKVGLYILISTDSIYDVCEKNHEGLSLETDNVRPNDEEERKTLIKHFDYGHKKLEAEEALMQQRMDGGFPFVILRLPDVVGPRDTTYRWWIYQLWLKLAPKIPERPIQIPEFLKNLGISFVYVEDVARAILKILETGPQIRDQAINLAYPAAIKLEDMLSDIQADLGVNNKLEILQSRSESQFFVYPSVRKGPISVVKAQELFGFKPTPWNEVVRETNKFYEECMVDEKWAQQRDEIIQIVGSHIYSEHKVKFFKALEEEYKINLTHFTEKHDEL